MTGRPAIHPGQTWCRRNTLGTVRVHLVTADRVGYRSPSGKIHYVARARFEAAFERVLNA